MIGPSLSIAQEAMSRRVLDVADYPLAGVMFKDVTPLLADPAGFAAVVDVLAGGGRDNAGNVAIDKVIGIEARGFIFGAPVALALGVGFVPVRKGGKLPRATHSVSYSLEYADATLEIHQDAISPGERVLLIDDVLATGGTLTAARELVEACGGTCVRAAVLMEFTALNGRAAAGDLPISAITTV